MSRSPEPAGELGAVKQPPRIAILVACHNDAETLSETIDSLRGEPATELVIVDDGSTDPETLAELVRLQESGIRVLRQENAGPSSAWTAGLGATTAPYVMPFSSDDVLVPGATAGLAAALDANGGAAVSWGDIESFGMTRSYVPSAPTLCPWHLTYVNCRPGIALFRRDLLVQAGGWQEEGGIEDWDLWLRLAARGFEGVYVPTLIYHYRRDAAGRFREQSQRFDAFYERLRERNPVVFANRAANRAASPAPRSLKALLPLVDRLPRASRLLKVQVSEALTLLLWTAGPRRTARIVADGLAFRTRLLTGRRGEGRGASPKQMA